jgi:protein disulfide-isomerase
MMMMMLLWCAPYVAAMDIVPWLTDVEAAFATSREENRPLLLHFFTNDCIPCQKLDQNVFSRKSVSETLVDFFIPVKVNAQEHPELAAKYRVDRFPTDVILGPGDDEIDRMITPQNAQQYVAQLSAIAFRSGIVPRHRSQQELARASSTAESQFAPPTSGSLHEATTSTVTTNATASSSQSMAREVLNPYAGRGNPQRAAAAPSNTVGAGEVPAADRHPDYDAPRPGTQTAAASRSTPFENHVAGRATPGLGNGNANGRRDIAPDSAATPRANAAPSHPAIALDGYCPVTVIKNDVWQKADPRWGVVHRGRTYLFAGEREKNEFYANPDHYSPVLSGLDPVALTESGEVVEGKRAHGVVYGQQMYLFASEENLKKFWQAPDQYAGPVTQAMQSVGQTAIRR